MLRSHSGREGCLSGTAAPGCNPPNRDRVSSGAPAVNRSDPAGWRLPVARHPAPAALPCTPRLCPWPLARGLAPLPTLRGSGEHSVHPAQPITSALGVLLAVFQ